MASLGHVAVGLAVARSQQRQPEARALLATMAWYSLLALLPDIDVIGFLALHRAPLPGHLLAVCNHH